MTLTGVLCFSHKPHLRLALTLIFYLLVPGAGLALDDRPTVVELYTSQGCSSCIIADRHMQQLSKREEVIALTFPVTYWDYLGWKDTLAKPEFDARQRAYATAAGSADIYTPQIIIDGVYREVGSETGVIDEVITYQTGARPPAVGINLWPGPLAIAVNIGAGTLPPGAQSASIRLIQYDTRQFVSVKAGENAGKELVYFNIVRSMTSVGIWQGQSMGLNLPIRDFRKAGYSGIAVLLQVDDGGPILGAAKMDFSRLEK